MRLYDIVDGSRRNAKPCARLSYNENDDSIAIEIAEEAGENDVPMLLDAFVAQGRRTVGGDWAKRWVTERTVPASRQNLGEVLKAHNLEFYDAFTLFEAAEGRCSQDDFYIVRVPIEEEKQEVATPNLAEEAGRKLREARRQAGLTQMELAHKVGVNQAVVSRLENGHGNPTMGLVQDVARALGLEPHIELETR